MSSHARGLSLAALFGLLAGTACSDITGTRSAPADPALQLEIVPGTLELIVGQSAQLALQGRSAAGYQWSTDNPDVASVSPAGLVTAGSVGIATVTVGEGSGCLVRSARPAHLVGAPGAYGACASATIFVLEKSERRRKY